MADSLFGKELQGFGFFRKKPEPFVRNIVLNEITYRGRTIPLIIPLYSEIEYDGTEYTVCCEEILCIGSGKSMKRAMEDFCGKFMAHLEISMDADRTVNERADIILRHVEG